MNMNMMFSSPLKAPKLTNVDNVEKEAELSEYPSRKKSPISTKKRHRYEEIKDRNTSSIIINDKNSLVLDELIELPSQFIQNQLKDTSDIVYHRLKLKDDDESFNLELLSAKETINDGKRIIDSDQHSPLISHQVAPQPYSPVVIPIDQEADVIQRQDETWGEEWMEAEKIETIDEEVLKNQAEGVQILTSTSPSEIKDILALLKEAHPLPISFKSCLQDSFSQQKVSCFY